MTRLEPHSVAHSRRPGDGVAGRKRDTSPRAPGARPPQPGARGQRPRPGRHETLMAHGGRPTGNEPVSRALAGPAGGPDVVVDLIRRWFTITLIPRGT